MSEKRARRTVTEDLIDCGYITKYIREVMYYRIPVLFTTYSLSYTLSIYICIPYAVHTFCYLRASVYFIMTEWKGYLLSFR